MTRRGRNRRGATMVWGHCAVARKDRETAGCARYFTVLELLLLPATMTAPPRGRSHNFQIFQILQLEQLSRMLRGALGGCYGKPD
jgi:hypothetical protein